MRPQKGDFVKFTDRFLNNSSEPWVSSLKNVKLHVVKLKLKTISPFKIYTFFIMANNMLYKVDTNETGHFVEKGGSISNDMVFELFQDVSSSVNPIHAWAPHAPVVSSSPATKEEANSTCLQCGSPAIDLLFSMKCTNSSCKNYK